MSVSPHTVLALLTSSYLVGEMGHFMLGGTSRDMARDIGFGDKECVPRQNVTEIVTENVTENVTEVTQCMTLSREECEDTNLCQWDYTGRGLDYQVLLTDLMLSAKSSFIVKLRVIKTCLTLA